MANHAVDVGVRVNFDGHSATAGVNRFFNAVRTGSNNAVQQQERNNRQQDRSLNASLSRRHSSLSHHFTAYSNLGMRSERQIQQEINRTQASYNRLANSGRLSMNEQARAAEALRRRLAELNREMSGGAANNSGLRVAAGRVGVLAAGAVAAGAAVKEPINAAIDYDTMLTHMANTAFKDRDTAGRLAGKKQLAITINDARRDGGGTNEQVAATLNTLLAQGLDYKTAEKVLASVVKTATAGSADPNEIAAIALKSMQTFGIKKEDLPNLFNMAVASGQEGGFELKDMAKWLPEQLAAATNSGLKGKQDFASILALNQASIFTAGSEDKSGNNVKALLSKINSEDTAIKAKKMGVNLPAYLQKKRSEGFGSIDAFAMLVDETVNKRADYKQLKAQLATAKDGTEKKAVLDSMAMIAKGAGIGQLVQDQESMMALLAIVNDPKYYNSTRKAIMANDVSANGAVDKNYATVAQSVGFGKQQRQEDVKHAERTGASNTFGTVDFLNKKISAAFNVNPNATGSALLIAKAGAAATATVGAAGLLLRGVGVRPASLVPAVVRNVAASPAAAAVGRGAIKFAKIGGGLGVASIAADYALPKAFGEKSAISRYGTNILGKAAFGATAGAAAGSVFPVVGTAVGGVVGGIVGAIGGAIETAIKSYNSKQPDAARTLTTAAPKPQKVEIQPPIFNPVQVNTQVTVGLQQGLIITNQNSVVNNPNTPKTGNVLTDVE